MKAFFLSNSRMVLVNYFEKDGKVYYHIFDKREEPPYGTPRKSRYVCLTHTNMAELRANLNAMIAYGDELYGRKNANEPPVPSQD